MTAGTNTAPSANQAEANTGRTAIDNYAEAAAKVVQTISSRDATHGDPAAFGETFATFLNAYLSSVQGAGRELVAADAFVILDLMKTARIANGGPHLAHFTDKAGYALLGIVAAADDASPVASVAFAVQAAPEPAPEPASPVPAAVSADPAPTPAPAVTAAPAEPEDQEDDADLIRWALDPGSDPFADLMDADKPRAGVTADQIEARRVRLVGLLNAYQPKSPTEAMNLRGALTHYGQPIPVAA